MEENKSLELSTTYKAELNIYNNASLLKISDEEQKKLLASFDTKKIEIRPDGLIYLPQTFWRKRLNESFGIGQWCLIVKSSTKDPDRNKLYLQGILLVRGNYVAEAVGEAEYHQDNALQSWASVWESAKSDCITRCCKDLGIASELWQPEFIKSWIKDNSIQVWRNTTGKHRDKKSGQLVPGSFQWRKKISDKFWDEGKEEPSKKEEPAKEVKSAENLADQTRKTSSKIPAKHTLSEIGIQNVIKRIKQEDYAVYQKALDTFDLSDEQKKRLKDVLDIMMNEAAKPELTQDQKTEILENQENEIIEKQDHTKDLSYLPESDQESNYCGEIPY
jgi:hypothetical protein